MYRLFSDLSRDDFQFIQWFSRFRQKTFPWLLHIVLSSMMTEVWLWINGSRRIGRDRWGGIICDVFTDYWWIIEFCFLQKLLQSKISVDWRKIYNHYQDPFGSSSIFFFSIYQVLDYHQSNRRLYLEKDSLFMCMISNFDRESFCVRLFLIVWLISFMSSKDHS